MADVKKFLDSAGVGYLWSKIATELNKKADTSSLATVATTGAAANVSIADAGNLITATNVEAALQEIVTNLNNANTANAVTVEKTTGGANDTYAYRYVFKQGGTALTNGTIDIAKDMVATSGSLVHPTAQDPITIGGESVTSGAYIAMNIANGDTFYINVADLIEYNTFSDTDTMIKVTDTNHTITFNLIDASITKAKLASGVQASLDAADSAVQSVVTGSTNGTISVDGTDVAVYGLGSAAYTASTAYDAAGAAAAVVGTSSDAASANTVYGAKKYAEGLFDALSQSEIDDAITAAAS